MAKILIIGAGFVGKATGKGLHKAGHDVTFVDISEAVITNLKAENFKAFLTNEIGNEPYDFIFICLPTPYDVKMQMQDMGIVKSSVKLLAKILKNSTKPTIVLRSTVLPGTSKSIIKQLEYLTNAKEGEDFYFCMNPEFLRAKSALEDFMHPWVVVIGSNKSSSAENLIMLFQDFINKDKIFNVSLEEAEFLKYFHNIFNATKISFANQVWLITKRFGIDGNKIMNIIQESAEGSWNKKYGMYGGMPYGGLCLPKDIKGFLAWLKDVEIEAPLIRAVDEINNTLEDLAEKGDAKSAVRDGINWLPSPIKR